MSGAVGNDGFAGGSKTGLGGTAPILGGRLGAGGGGSCGFEAGGTGTLGSFLPGGPKGGSFFGSKLVIYGLFPCLYLIGFYWFNQKSYLSFFGGCVGGGFCKGAFGGGRFGKFLFGNGGRLDAGFTVGGGGRGDPDGVLVGWFGWLFRLGRGVSFGFTG